MMGWKKLKAGDTDKVQSCVHHASKGAKEHEKHFGKTAAEHKVAAGKLCNRIAGGRMEAWYLDKHKGGHKEGEVGLFFQRMNWLSDNTKLSPNGVWVVSVVFEDDRIFKKPQSGDPGKDTDYTDFLDMLNRKPDKDGPLQSFMKAHGVTSLFFIDAFGASPPNKKKEISWLQLVAKSTWKPANGSWKIKKPITIDCNYVGMDGTTKIPDGVLKYWGGDDRKFELVEAQFTP